MALETVAVADVPGTIITRQTHTLDLSDLCPKTNNPLPGSVIEISYKPKGRLLEVYSLSEYIRRFARGEKIRDIEYLCQQVASDCGDALGVEVDVVGRFILNIGQTVEVKVWGSG